MACEFKEQTYDENFSFIDCPTIDPCKDYSGERTGYYFLIRLTEARDAIEVAVVSEDHVILQGFRGKTAQDLYITLFNYEKENNLNWAEDKTHIAYLGKELRKAQQAIETGGEYWQE